MERAAVEQRLQEITEKIVREFQPEKIILFGSWAWGTPGPDSDADLLVIKRSSLSRPQRERELQTLLSPRQIALDVMVYTPEELQRSIHENHNLFIEDIIRNGRVIYEHPDSRISITLPERPLVILQ